MAKITQEELLKIAAISNLRLYEQEVPALIGHIQAVLDYSARVQQAAQNVDDLYIKAINVMREDVVIASCSEALLARAPQVEHHYFVVPKVIES